MVVPLLAACKGDGDEETTAFPTTGSTSSGSDTEGTDTTAGTAGSTGVDPT